MNYQGLNNNRENLADKDLFYALGTLDVCWVVCEELPNGGVGVTVEVIDSYKFIPFTQNGGIYEDFPAWANNNLGRSPQEKGTLTPYAVWYQYSTTR